VHRGRFLGAGPYHTKQGDAALNAGLAACNAFCATEKSRFRPELFPHPPPVDHIVLPKSYGSLALVVASWPADKKNLSDHGGVIVEVKE
jgi:hypothetical protein